MEGDKKSSMMFWGLALGGMKNPTQVELNPVQRPFRITKAVLNEPIRLQSQHEYASIYLEVGSDESDLLEVELFRFVFEGGVEKLLDVTFNRGDKVSLRVIGFPAPTIHLIGHYLVELEAKCFEEGSSKMMLQRLLTQWNDKMMVQLVEREMERKTNDRREDEHFAKLKEMITNLESDIRTKVNDDHAKISVLMGEIRGEIRLLRDGIGGIVDAKQEEVKRLLKDLKAADLNRRLDAMQKEIESAQSNYDGSMNALKVELEIKLELLKKELKKTINSSFDFEEDFEELKSLVRSMERN